MVRLNQYGTQGTPLTVFPGNWPNNLPDGVVENVGNNYNAWDWEEYTSVSIDPADDVTFWATGQYLPNGNQGTSPVWDTQIFLCQEGVTPGFCP